MKRVTTLTLAALLAVLVANVESETKDSKTNVLDQYGEAMIEAEKGNADAQYRVGARLVLNEFANEGTEPTKEKLEAAAQWFQKAAQQGHPRAQLELGAMLLSGLGLPQDTNQAVKWYRTAADRGGLAEAQHTLGFLYQKGIAVRKDQHEAFNWYRKAAEQGYAPSLFNLGNMYAYGELMLHVGGLSPPILDNDLSVTRIPRGEQSLAPDPSPVTSVPVKRDLNEALRFYRAAAEKGLAEAQFELGTWHADGRVVPSDDKEAMRWFQKAADQGHAFAQVHVANWYAMGKRVPRDYAKAAQWYRTAAEQGVRDAQHKLGLMYSKGQGVRLDLVEAYKWLNLSAVSGGKLDGALGDLVAQEYARWARHRDELEKKMTPEQIAEAQRRSAAFVPKKPKRSRQYDSRAEDTTAK